MRLSELKTGWEKGFFIIRNAFTAKQIQEIENDIIDSLSEPENTCTDVLNKHPKFLKHLTTPQYIKVLREIFAEDFKFLQHSDIHANFFATNWHRDSTCRNEECEGPDWDNLEHYKILRTAIYTRPTQFQVIPYSHTVPGLDSSKSLTIETRPTDIILFDPRIYHRAPSSQKAKYSLFFTFGIENGHSRRHINYYLEKRRDLGYTPMSADLKLALLKSGLLASSL